MINKQKIITVGNIKISNDFPLVLIAGPCQIENRDHALRMAESIKSITTKLNIPFIYKSSFDKANRTSIDGKRGIGIDKSLAIFAEIKKEFGCPVLTDVHAEYQCDPISEVVDILQIPAFLCRQTDLLISAAKTNKVVNVKKGQFLAPNDVGNIIKKITSQKNDNIMLTERGTTFGYNNLISDMRSIKIMSDTGYPVVFDATHSVQQPGGEKNKSGGQREFVETLSRAAVAVGLSTIFMEVHQDPDNAPSDGPCMIKLNNLEKLLINLKRIDEIVKN